MVPGSSGHHPGHCRIAVRARPRRWDVRLSGAPRQWHEASGEGYPPPRGIGRQQPLGCPLNRGPAAVEEIPSFVAMGAADDPHGPLRVPQSQPKVARRRVVGVTTVECHFLRFMVPTGPQLSGRLPTGGRLPRGASL